MADACERVPGVDVVAVMKEIGLDGRTWSGLSGAGL